MVVLAMGVLENDGPLTSADKTPPRKAARRKSLWSKLFGWIPRRKGSKQFWGFEHGDDEEPFDSDTMDGFDEPDDFSGLGYYTSNFLDMNTSASVSSFLSLSQKSEDDDYDAEEDPDEAEEGEYESQDIEAAPAGDVDFVDPGKSRNWVFTPYTNADLVTLNACNTVVSTGNIELAIDFIITHAKTPDYGKRTPPIDLKGHFSDFLKTLSSSGTGKSSCTQPFWFRNTVGRHQLLRIRVIASISAGHYRSLEAQELHQRLKDAIKVQFRCASRFKNPCLINYYLSCVRISCSKPSAWKTKQQRAIAERNKIAASVKPRIVKTVDQAQTAWNAELDKLIAAQASTANRLPTA